MRYLKFKEEDRVLQAIESLMNDDRFTCIVENLVEPTSLEATSNVVDMQVSNDELPVSQGVARVMREFLTICRDVSDIRRRHNKR